MKLKRFLSFFAAFALVFLIGGRGLGYRTLWQDEVETAERAKSVAYTGVPRVYDPNGNWSLNTGGKEIEEGDLHRYTPWGQFYAGAAGILIGDRLGLDRDTSVRLPFFVFHAAVSGLIAASLPAILSITALEAIGVSTLYGLESVRIIHARTARYHGMTDFFFFLAFLLYGIYRRSARDSEKLNRSLASLLGLHICIGFILHTHTLFGSLSLGLFSFLILLEFPKDRRTYFFLFLNALCFFSLIELIRPWYLQETWGGLGFFPFRSLKTWSELLFSVSFFMATFLFFTGLRERKIKLSRSITQEIFFGSLFVAFIVCGIRVLDFQPLSQPRYYLPIVSVLLFWPFAFGERGWWGKRNSRVFLGVLVATLVVAEWIPPMIPYQGIRIAFFDARMKKESESSDPSLAQPLRKAFEAIKRDGRSGDGVFMEYVPQLVNWYLPEFKPALLPDLSTLSRLGRENPRVISEPFIEPQWHLYYRNIFDGFWVCGRGCDMKIILDPKNPDAYFVHSGRLNKDFRFCKVQSWLTHYWNNAPYSNYLESALTPDGMNSSVLILSKRCD